MSEVEKLIAEARQWANGHPNRRSGELMGELADALEVAEAERDAAVAAPVLDVEKIAEALIDELSDIETGALSDTPYVFAEVNGEGHLELFERSGGWPTAVIDIPQLAEALVAALGTSGGEER